MKHNNREKMIKEFSRATALEMFEEMLEWLAKNQVNNLDDPNNGAIYFPTEDRFCNRDSACMARAFMRQYTLTGDDKWLKKATMARDYVLNVQKPNGGFPEMRGTQESDGGSNVNTPIIAANLIKAYELGLGYTVRDLDALQRMADFVLSLEWQPGSFCHDTNHQHAFGERWGDEGSQQDCQNTTALAAMMLKNVYYFLEKNCPEKADVAWIEGAKRAIKHIMEGQDEDGQWPYLVGAEWKDAGHHSMCMTYLIEAAYCFPCGDRSNISKALTRGANWLIDEALLQTKRGTKINWARGRSACLYFTAEYFFIAGSLAHMANLDSESAASCRHEALELMRYVRNDLWDNINYEAEGPAKLTEAGIKLGYAWFGQSMGWVIYQLDDLIDQMGWWNISE